MGSNAMTLPCTVCQIPVQISAIYKCDFCQHDVCKGCKGYPVYDEEREKHSQGCKECFKKANQIDLSKNHQIIGDDNNKEIIFLHGATFSRLMFQGHAHDLTIRGFRCILVDLPGHGSRMNQTLNVQNCEKTIRDAIQLCKTKQITLIGGSLGGYILMNLFGRNPNLCKKAVILMCGQNVGINRSLKASLGLWSMNKSFKLISQPLIANIFLSMTKKNPNLQAKRVLKLVRGGCYLRHIDQNIELLKNCDYRQSLAKIEGKIPILFINGSKDYRDYEQIWLQVSGKDSKLIVYEGGDHFFSHDKRFYNRLIDDIVDFIQK